ncbi:MAG: hypothetical protein ACKVX9_01420 [Blastocatellia bacterium]
MKRLLGLRKTRAGITGMLVTALLCSALAPLNPARGQDRSRMIRPPQRDLEGAMILPAGARELPEGYVLILRMEKRLESDRALKSDRFTAIVDKPVIDANGQTLILEGTIIEGHVTRAEPAKWRRRSGVIGINFDSLYLDGKKTPITGYLTAADASDRKRLDSEGNWKGGSLTKRDIVFVGGGAGAGATIGVIAGTSLLAASGIGAAAGLTAALLMKGKEAVVEEGQLVGLELSRPYRPGAPWYAGGRQTPLDSGASGGVQTPSLDPNELRTIPGQVKVYDVHAERGADGYLRIFITAETPTSGWRIFTHHLNRGDTIEAWARGVPPAGTGVKRTDHPSAPIIIVQDQNRAITRAIVHGSNGTRTFVISNTGGGGLFGGGSAQPPTTSRPPGSGGGTAPPSTARPGQWGTPSDGSTLDFPYYPPTGGAPGGSTGGSGARPQNPPPSSGGTGSSGGGQPPTPTSVAALAARSSNELEVVRAEYAGAIGGYRNRDGSYDFSTATRRPSAAERQLLDSLGFMSQSTRELANGSLAAQSRRRSAVQLRDDLQSAQLLWTEASRNPDTNRKLQVQGTDRKWLALQQSLRSLIDSANR